ncbi:MAG TPA: type 4a pilus biogenesis protein PilO [Terriglobia bacterium]|nr:type 4a pilus biogenesis protein PilO [Terriglobia bacterium]
MAVEMKDFLKLKWYYQVLITAAVCGGLLGLVWYQFLSPIQDDIAQKNKAIEDLQKTIATTLQQQKQLAKIKKDAIDLQGQLDMLKMILPQEKETDQIFRNVQQMAMLSGLSVSRVAPRPQPIDHEIYLEYPVDLDISGKYHNVGVFLDRIRQLPRIVSISGLRLAGRGAQGDAAAVATVGASFTATTYVYKEEAIASTAPPPKPVK